jgi:ribosome-associated protein
MHESDDDNFDSEDLPSKSARKRAMQHLQDLGEQIGGLRPEQIKALELPERLEKELFELKRIKAREAIRRQVQFIGKLMRELDINELEAKLSEQTASTTLQAARFKSAEKWRDRLLKSGADPVDIDAFCVQYPDTERKQLLSLATAAQQEQLSGLNRGHSKQLFRFIYAVVP